MKTLPQHIRSIETQLQLNGWIKALLLALSVGLVAFTLGLPKPWATMLGVGLMLVFQFAFGGFRSKRKEAIHILHEEAGNLEFSLELLEKSQLTIADRMQLERIGSKIPPRITVFHRGLLPFVLAFGFVYLLSFGLDYIPDLKEKNQGQAGTKENFPATLVADAPVLLTQTQVRIQSPDYTGIPAQLQDVLDIKAMKGSLLTWTLGFGNRRDLDVFLVNSSGDKLDFQASDSGFQLSQELISSGIYSIQAFRDSVGVFESDFYTIESIEDQSPQIIPEEKEIYKFFFPGNDPKLSLKADIRDDFRVNQVEIVATLVRGKGENVKFRETRFPVETVPFQSKISGFVLNVSSLDFQPGDELYYYWTAVDNKSPEANTSRTDTYFIKYFDDSEESNAVLEGMAIQVLPEYFRSQRQIIIDTEKLLAEKSRIAEKKFNSTSNEIGYDQKLLRLRYGQYLGEEFETAAVGVVVEPENDGDMLAGYRHLHDQEGEHEEVLPLPTQSAEAGHGHEVEESEAGSMESLMSEYIHAHDSEEMNTYFEQSTRGALKSALEQMWQAELYMRLFEPEKSLPYQYKALELLKTVQQKSRVYVKRTGYDPPPIKEDEKRLSGELDKLDQAIQKEQIQLASRIEPLASAVLGMLVQPDLSAQDRVLVWELGTLWAGKAQNSQLEDLNLLLYLQQLESGKLEDTGKKYLREKLYPLARNYKNTSVSYPSSEALKTAFRKNLK
ncbi:hypothetical protein [Algoriphagus sp. A40]|uniref:hypothetical protein n=1 Tax=Algoriphagus sp. A40 TaxID=1945863 RepID=UPI0009846868|nr:hypothetical protein [Algoriphagus sp. A40]OOG72829.1 hypothetical protein B0E43_15335 [Algoriphagus sp. A40]